jgi:hypothetical protein
VSEYAHLATETLTAIGEQFLNRADTPQLRMMLKHCAVDAIRQNPQIRCRFTVDVEGNSGEISLRFRDLDQEERMELEHAERTAKMMAEIAAMQPARDRAVYEDWRAWFISRYGEEIGTFLVKRAASAVHKKWCVDNYRVCDLANLFEVAEYELRRSKGCCGFFDKEIAHRPSGRRFRIGFNYGH